MSSGSFFVLLAAIGRQRYREEREMEHSNDTHRFEEGDRVAYRYNPELQGVVDNVREWVVGRHPIGYGIQWDNGEYGVYLPEELLPT